ncbi:nuclear receptor coactivator 5-like isoform X3 [Rhinatrema bivittatum]|uniref:nuclear receptor coactivator 5-like isoform X3 n=1 Tax=Rhinatrema bivittatum TaxID=194408 RepID=UPI00112E2A4C|nr:nuclear receptor coactivator 5-like isoform X3 [Rhinatrema bivittatum]
MAVAQLKLLKQAIGKTRVLPAGNWNWFPAGVFAWQEIAFAKEACGPFQLAACRSMNSLEQAEGFKMSSWVKVTRGHAQKPAVEKSRHKPGWIPRLLDINPHKPYQKSPYSIHDGYTKDFEDVDSFEELLGQRYDYSSGAEDNYERYQYSQTDEKYTRDDRREKLYLQFYQQIQKEYDKERPSDCVVVAISKEQAHQMKYMKEKLFILEHKEYATGIGHRLQDHGLVVEMIYLVSEAGLTRALQEVKNDGSPFCILVEQSNVALSSCTVIMLHESIKIHRNMPMDDALTLVVKAFGNIFAEREQQERKEISHKAADLADDYLERELYECYNVPLGVRHLVFLLSEGKYLSREEINSITDYLKTRKNELEGYVEQPDPSTEVDNTMYQTSVLAGTSSAAHTLSKPPPLLPTPSKTSLLGHSPMSQGKPSLLGDRPGLLPLPGMSGPKGKPPPLLAAPSKRPGLLGFSPGQPAKRPLLGDKPGLLPTPEVLDSGWLPPSGARSLLLERSPAVTVPHQRPAKPKALLS